MDDFRGQELNVGNKVIFIHKEVFDVCQKLREGTITKITPQKVEVEFQELYSIGNKLMRTKKVLKSFPHYQIFKLA